MIGLASKTVFSACLKFSVGRKLH